MRHLITNLKTRKLAEMDPEEFYSFTDTRPLVSIVGAGERAIHWPRGEFHGAALEHTSDLVLFVAPEPNLKWRTFASVMLDGMQRFGVQSMVCIGSIFGAVPHRGDVRMTGWANDDALARRAGAPQRHVHQLRGPDRLRHRACWPRPKRAGCRRSRCTASRPTTSRACPIRACRTRCCRRFRGSPACRCQLTDLDRAGRALARQVDRLLQDQPQLREQVERMLSLMNVAEPLVEPDEEPEPVADDEPPNPNVELPSPQAVVTELEEFLKQLRRKDPGATIRPDA